jgi:hypothetical protein
MVWFEQSSIQRPLTHKLGQSIGDKEHWKVRVTYRKQMKLHTPGDRRKQLRSVLHGTPLPVISLYYEICEPAMHDSLAQPHTCSHTSTLLRFLPPPSVKWTAQDGRAGRNQGYFYRGRTVGDLNENPNSANIVTSLLCCLIFSIALILSLWANLLRNICRPLYCLAVCRHLYVTDSIAQNCLQITINIFNFSKYATVRLRHFGTTIPEMYV